MEVRKIILLEATADGSSFRPHAHFQPSRYLDTAPLMWDFERGSAGQISDLVHRTVAMCGRT